MKVVYTSEQRRVAIATYRKVHSYSKTCRTLGYPSRHTLMVWVKEYGLGWLLLGVVRFVGRVRGSECRWA